MKKKKNLLQNKWIAPLLVCFVSVFWILLGFLGGLQKFDFRGYDILLSLKKNPKTSSKVLLVEVDNTALEALGPWPWTRDIFADSLLRMKELGAETAVFDIEYLSPSNLAANPAIDNTLLNLFENEKKDISSAVGEFSSAVYKGDYSVRELPSLAGETLNYLIYPGLDKLRQSVRDSIYVDNDDYFARAIQFFGNTWLTINTSDLDLNYEDDFMDYVQKRFFYVLDDPKNFTLAGNRRTFIESLKKSGFDKSSVDIDWDDKDSRKKYQIGLSPALPKFITHAVGAGFTNVVIDSDGSRRRIELFSKQDEGCIGQLSVAPMLSFLKPEKLLRQKNTMQFLGAHIPEEDGSETVRDIKIPLDEQGRMLINWKHDAFGKSFKHESVLFLGLLQQSEQNIATILSKLSEFKWDITSGNELQYISVAKNLLLDYSDITQYKDFLLSKCDGYDVNGLPINGGINANEQQEYFSLRKTFFENVTAFSNGEYIEEIENFLMSSRDALGEEVFQELAQGFENLFETLKNEVNIYNSYFNDMKASYEGKFCIIGNTASSTTDLGTTPFERSYPNVGTHANIFNTIINNDFIHPVSWKISAVIAALLSLVLVFVVSGKNVKEKTICGIGLVVLAILIPSVLMICFGVYVPIVAPLFITLSSYVMITVLSFVNSERDKRFLQNTFGAYVAPSVVDEIVKNPDVAKLGGKTDSLTALFSDVATFSGFTETINNEEGEDKGAERLVSILNDYLGALSDAIMDNNGTIDKYVGDEIVSFFGAPIPNKNNAFDACVAGIRMLQAEKKYNEENVSKLPINPKTGKPFYLHSRVGLNTGNMVVGNMGTDKKLNYTIMGNNVNLASRLEGTNKVYGSWMMISESTWLAANSDENEGKLIVREFDAVRVINVKKPVRIYNVLGLRSEMPEAQIRAAEIFNEGMKWYMKGSDTPDEPKDKEDLKKAYELYKQADEMYPDDASSKVFMERCEDFLKNGLPEQWDGVYTMKSK